MSTIHHCSLISTDVGQPLPQPHPFAQRQSRIREQLPIRITGNLAIQSPEKNATFPLEVTYHTLDSATILLRDPLGRKQIKVQTHPDGYELWLLRERKYLSGRELPTQLLEHRVPTLSIQELHSLLLGLLPCESPRPLAGDSLSCPADTMGQWIFALGSEQSLLQSGTLLAASGHAATRFQYQNYEFDTGLALPALIRIVNPADSTEILIHFSHFTLQFHKFTERSDKPWRIVEFWYLLPQKISFLS